MRRGGRARPDEELSCAAALVCVCRAERYNRTLDGAMGVLQAMITRHRDLPLPKYFTVSGRLKSKCTERGTGEGRYRSAAAFERMVHCSSA